MEIRHPILMIILIILCIFFLLFTKKRKTKYSYGSKIANTNFIKQTDYFKNKLKTYKKIKAAINICCIISIFCSIILLSRIAKTENGNTYEYNRDIFLCMDVSSSVDELNKELVKNLKKTVNSLKGERFGISIFNTSSVTLVPLTDDYDYVLNILDKIGKSIDANNYFEYNDNLDDDSFYKRIYLRDYIISGTQEDAEIKGSSLIGDGLTSCIYSFSNLNEKRTRIIIFSTDNELSGTPLLTLNEATNISKNKNIKVFGIGTSFMKENDKKNLKEAVEKTRGKFYEQNSSTVKKIVDDIEKTSKSSLKNKGNKTKLDFPQVPFIILTLAIFTLIILNKKVVK